VVVKNYRMTDESEVKCLAFMCHQLHRYGCATLDEFAPKGNMDLLRIITGQREYAMSFNKNYIVIAIYIQPNEFRHDDGTQNEDL
jgi:hypothetical protein